MFTGCIEKTGILHERIMDGEKRTLTISSDLAKDIKTGDSISVNGACLTVQTFEIDKKLIEFHTLSETLRKTNLGTIAIGSVVNLERALCLNDRLDGHLVTGHVDTVASVLKVGKKQEDVVIEIELIDSLAALVVDKGSITVDGISLTVVTVTKHSFTVHIIPYTVDNTNLQPVKVGQKVNLEMDIIGKYIQRSLKAI